ncbi:MAG: right-handed parallel beta-helix repeat-containing protein, partial [Promethearchaeota archaeon]
MPDFFLLIPKHAYDEHPIAIEITGNTEFQNQASLNGWIGDGSESFPYSIDNLNITNSTTAYPLLSITDTDVYFNITNSLFVGGLYCIYLDNVTNGLIYNNIIKDSSDAGALIVGSYDLNLTNNDVSSAADQGIYLVYSNETIIYNNTVWNNADIGILCDYTEDVVIWNNSINDNDYEGIKVREGEENIIKDNLIYNNGLVGFKSGIEIGNSDENNMTGNFIFGNGYHGIQISASDNNNIHRNAIYNNQATGLSMNGKHNVTQNTFYDNTQKGIHSWSTGSNITHNNFIDNNLGTDPDIQAEDFGTNYYNNNFWSGWIIPDENFDGYVDIPYTATGLTDDFPLTTAVVNSMLHLLSRPQVEYPNGDVFVQGIVNITWGAASDTFGHEINYSLHYSLNNGSSWDLIQDNLDDVYHLWDTTGITVNELTLITVTAHCVIEDDWTTDTSDSTFFITNVPHTISKPSIITPSMNDTINGTITIEWETAVDSWLYDITYELYYSDNESDFNLIVDGLHTTSYIWDTTDVPDGETELMVVAINEIDEQVFAKTGTIIIKNEPDPEPEPEPEPKIPGYSSILIVGISIIAIV